MTIKQNGGVFGRNPTFNDVTIEGQLTFDGDIDINSDLKVQGEIESSGDIIVGSSGSIGVRDTNPVNGYVTVRGASTVGTKNGHIMLTGDSSTVGEGPQVVFSESGSGSNWVGAAIGFTRTGGSGIGDLSFSTRQTAGDANTTAVEAMKINSAGNVYVSTGNLVMSTSGKGIDFSATAGTGTSELLDDYEEGVFTPQLLFGGASVGMTGSFVGRYTKVGRVVYYTAVIYLSAKGSSTGNTTISGFPFASSASSTFYEGKMDTDNVTGMAYQFIASMPTNSTTLNVYVNVNGTQNNVADGSYADNSRLYITGFYEV